MLHPTIPPPTMTTWAFLGNSAMTRPLLWGPRLPPLGAGAKGARQRLASTPRVSCAAAKVSPVRLPAISRDLLRRLATLRDGLSLAACLLCLGCFAAVCLASYLAARWDADRRAQSLAATTASVAAAEIGRV